MKNKVLISLEMPEIDVKFDMFIPVNEVVWKIKELILKGISDVLNFELDLNDEFILINKKNSTIYSNNDIIINTDIRNYTELILISN
ncbi:MAG: hypothetical protein Q4E75_00575 [bacterium]|nr:hypothetical protein [bacterium]